MNEHFDAVVVGSGFGGSVIAHTLTEAGLHVCLLERGAAYPPGKFPRSPADTGRNFWDPSENLYGLFDIWSFRSSEAIVASGLGGGSLIYANVLMRRPPEWFDENRSKGAWPLSYEDLKPHYDAVEAVLQPQLFPSTSDYRTLPKVAAFREAAQRAGLEPVATPLGVAFANEGEPPQPGAPLRETVANLHGAHRSTCRLCGECDIGCNSGSKNTLDLNYLSLAEKNGLVIRVMAEVRAFRPRPSEGNQFEYEVDYVLHRPDEGGAASTAHTIECRYLVLSAGTLGTTYLMLRNRSSFPRIGPALGTRYSANGDLLSFAVDCTDSTKGHKARPRVLCASSGPVITSTFRSSSGNGAAYQVQDAGYPEFAGWLAEWADVRRSIPRVARFAWNRVVDWVSGEPVSEFDGEVARLLGPARRSSTSLPMLGMGFDVPDGVFRLRRGRRTGTTYLDVDWNARGSHKHFRALTSGCRKITRELGGDFVENPLTRTFGRIVTVHPLGGCPMGDDPANSVVNSFGAVHGYPGMYIADGSVMPGPVGVNPSLTIAAFARRAAVELVRRARSPDAVTQPAPATETVPTPDEQAGLSFDETMRGYIARGQWDFRSGYENGRNASNELVLALHVTIDDLDRFLASDEHRASVAGRVSSDLYGDGREIESGSLDILRTSAGDLNRKLIVYRLHLHGKDGDEITITGYKDVHDDLGFDLWHDTTTLNVNVLSGHVAEGDDAKADLLAAGQVRMSLGAFAKELVSLKAHRRGGRPDSRTVLRFVGFFLCNLWEIYGLSLSHRTVVARDREIALHTTEGVQRASRTTHPFLTEDRIDLSLLRFHRRRCEDVVMIVHGLTTSSDMFIMPEHTNLVSYLLDHGFTDVWTLDFRMSNRFPYNLVRHRFTLDDVALFDFPAALRTIREAVGERARIHVIAHCLGAMTFSMSLFGGASAGVSSLVVNSVSLTPMVPNWSLFKGLVAPFLCEYVLNFAYLDPRWSQTHGWTLGKLFSKVVSAFHPECDEPACHMLSLMWGTGWPALYRHGNLAEVTHRRSGDLYGPTSLHYHRHVRKMILSDNTAVKYDPDNQRHDALPDDYLEHAADVKTPILFLTGQDNLVFRESNIECFRRLENIVPGRHELRVIPGYGHQDIFMGKRCAEDVFPHIVRFLGKHAAVPITTLDEGREFARSGVEAAGSGPEPDRVTAKV
ncbi:MAG: alpha/beta fold hydrolase [Burkholderiaceae bacterium]|jgi:cholesterol oxidase|nr:alpha/beta fold hydrolase [Burkholderiaceae bacterium]